MACRLVADGWRIEERGLPMATVSTAAIAIQVIANTRPQVQAQAENAVPATKAAARPLPEPVQEPAPAF